MSEKSSTFAADLKKWYLARAVRDRSAKPGTAVRIRQVPPEKPLEKAAFLILSNGNDKRLLRASARYLNYPNYNGSILSTTETT